MARVLLIIIAVGLVIFVVRALRQKRPPPGTGGQLPRREDRDPGDGGEDP